MHAGTDDATLRLSVVPETVSLPRPDMVPTVRIRPVDATLRLEAVPAPSPVPDPVPLPGPDPAELPIGKHLASYLQHLAVERGMARNTISAYRRDLYRYAAFLHGQDVDARTK